MRPSPSKPSDRLVRLYIIAYTIIVILSAALLVWLVGAALALVIFVVLFVLDDAGDMV